MEEVTENKLPQDRSLYMHESKAGEGREEHQRANRQEMH